LLYSPLPEQPLLGPGHQNSIFDIIEHELPVSVDRRAAPRQTVINMNSVMTSDDFWKTISQMDNVSVVRGSTGAQQSMHRRSRRQIPSGR
jgi:hypothetical protein